MPKKDFRYPFLCFVLFAALFLSGCETLKGTADGFKRDWDRWTKWDKEFQKVLW